MSAPSLGGVKHAGTPSKVVAARAVAKNTPNESLGSEFSKTLDDMVGNSAEQVHTHHYRYCHQKK